MSASPLILFPRADFRDMIRDITGLQDQVVWDIEPEPFLGIANNGPGYSVQLSVVANEEKGVDDVRQVYDPVNQVNGTTQVSWRVVTVRFRVRSLALQVGAFDVMDQIKRGLRSLSAKTANQAMGISVGTWGRTADTTPAADTKGTTEAVLDVTFNWQVSADPGDDDGTIIETVTSVTAVPPLS